MRVPNAILGLLLTLPLGAQAPAPDLRGIFSYTNDVSQITTATATQLTQSFSIPGVDGVAVVIGWDTIEPSMGQYNWTLLDQCISRDVVRIEVVLRGIGPQPADRRLDIVQPKSPLSEAPFACPPHTSPSGAQRT